jgi:predicted GNAT family acetyltransferase
MAGITAPAAGVARVVLAYTPRELRAHGYASACVAALTARQLAEPGRTCMLYTDLANPTSNGIYQAIGYRRIGEAVHIVFD